MGKKDRNSLESELCNQMKWLHLILVRERDNFPLFLLSAHKTRLRGWRSGIREEGQVGKESWEEERRGEGGKKKGLLDILLSWTQ